MKRKLIVVGTIFIVCTITIKVLSDDKNTYYNEEKTSIIRKNEYIISYFLENDNGEYEATTSSEWPTDGYKFNSTLSKCENDGELAWDDVNKLVTMSGYTSDKCYVYFDKNIVNLIINSAEVIFLSCGDYQLKMAIDYNSDLDISKIYFSINNSAFISYDFIPTTTGLGSGYENGIYNKYLFNSSIPSVGQSASVQMYLEDLSGNISNIYTAPDYIISCFPAGTKIFTNNGYRNIEDIKINDIVYSFNETTKKLELNKVTKTFVHQDIEIYNLYLDNEMIRVTPYHRFYALRNYNYEWVAVKDLKLTDKLFDSNKQLININKIEYIKENNAVYNFEVANNHTYFVSEKIY